jgi:hypothetical protein
LSGVRGRIFQHQRIIPQFFGDLRRRRRDDDGLAGKAQFVRQVAQLADDAILMPPALVEIPQHKDVFPLRLVNGLQQGDGILGLLQAAAIPQEGGEVIRMIPDVQGALAPLAHRLDAINDPLLLEGNHADQRTARPEVHIEFLFEVHVRAFQ